jgi:DNA-binding CsgD family transcriptional regulator
MSGSWTAKINIQISAELGIRYHTVRSRLSRGRVKLRGALRAELGIEHSHCTTTSDHEVIP